jgi:hypothetical protein
MQSRPIKTHNDGIWVSAPRERDIVEQFSQAILDQKFVPSVTSTINHGFPYIYQRGEQILHCRFVDSVFLLDPEAWTREYPSVIITDNIPLDLVASNLISVVPEFWSIWKFDPVYNDRPATKAYNCFMNRPRGDRSVTFYELIRRDLLSKGIVSYNATADEYEKAFVNTELERYTVEHKDGQPLIPYNTLSDTLEQCIINTRVSLILETYISDNHVVFSEKIFRALQMPRPWLLYCSCNSVKQLRQYGFDVLDDYVNHSYDAEKKHFTRLLRIIDQLETFVDREYSDADYEKFKQAAAHNQQLLKTFEKAWPAKFERILNQIKQL